MTKLYELQDTASAGMPDEEKMPKVAAPGTVAASKSDAMYGQPPKPAPAGKPASLTDEQWNTMAKYRGYTAVPQEIADRAAIEKVNQEQFQWPITKRKPGSAGYPLPGYGVWGAWAEPIADLLLQPKSGESNADRIHWQPGQIPMAQADEPAGGPAQPGAPAAGGRQPRYKLIDDPEARPGYAATKRVATAAGEVVDMSGKPAPAGMKVMSAVPGFNNQDLVDLYGGSLKSDMTDAEAAQQIAANKSMPEGWVWDASQGKAIPMPKSAAPRINLDASSPQALLASAIPWASQVGAERRKEAEQARQQKLFMDKYGIDLTNNLKRLEMSMAAPKIAAETQHNLAAAEKARTEAQAKPYQAKSLRGQLLLERAKELSKAMALQSPEEQAASRQEIDAIEQQLATIDAGPHGGAGAPQASARSSQPMAQLPDAKQHNGRRVVDDATGKKYVAQNGQWVEVR